MLRSIAYLGMPTPAGRSVRMIVGAMYMAWQHR